MEFVNAKSAGEPADAMRRSASVRLVAAARSWTRGLERRAVGAVVLLAIAAGLAGCQGIDMGAGSMAQLRVIDASPDAPAIDSYQNNAALAYNLGFGTVTSYVPMAPGGTTLAADRAGTRQALVATGASLSGGRQYTEIVGNVNAAMQETVLLDQSQPAPADEIAVRLVDEATRAGAVDVYLVPRGGKLWASTPMATGLSFGSNSGYRDLPAGVYELAVVPAGTAPTPTTATLLSGAQIEYASGAVRTVVLIDVPMAAAPAAAPLSAAPAATAARPGVQAIVADDCDPE